MLCHSPLPFSHSGKVITCDFSDENANSGASPGSWDSCAVVTALLLLMQSVLEMKVLIVSEVTI